MSPIRLRVREFREAQGLTQDQLSALAGVRQATISAMETGKAQRIDLDVLERLATALGVAPAAFLTSDERSAE